METQPLTACLGTTYKKPYRNYSLPLSHLEMIIENRFFVTSTELLSATRGPRPIARARQIAIYLGHVVLGLSLSALARHFRRDRTTVAYACRAVEDARDAREFDELLDTLEAQLVSLLPAAAQMRL